MVVVVVIARTNAPTVAAGAGFKKNGCAANIAAF